MQGMIPTDGSAPMKVEIGGRGGGGGQETPNAGKKTPGSRRNKGAQQLQQPTSFGMAPPATPVPLPGVDMAQMMNINMAQQMIYTQFMAPAMNPYFGVPPMFPSGIPGGMPAMYNPMAATLPQVGLPCTAPSLVQAPTKGSHKGGKGNSGGAHNAGGENRKSKPTRRGKNKGVQERENSPDLQDGGDNPDRSQALNQVRREGSKSTVTLQEVQDNVLEFARDQLGSRFLQNKLDDADKDQRQAVFEIIKGQACNLANDAFGNFVLQKYYDIGSVDQRKQLVQELMPKLVNLSNETHGCRVVQKAIQHVPRESQLAMAQKLKENVVTCIESMHGNHVIQKCIEQMPPDSVTFIIHAVEQEAQRMASHMYGCRVVQRLLEHCASHQLQNLLDRILSSIEILAVDPYGNYVVQHMLEHGRVEDKKVIIEFVTLRIVEFSKHKCSSNVVEKALEVATVGEHAQQLETERAALMHKVIGDLNDPDPPLRQMMDDRFGNFIVQRLIEHSRGSERERLRQVLDASSQHLQGSVHGKHILNALKKENMGM